MSMIMIMMEIMIIVLEKQFLSWKISELGNPLGDIVFVESPVCEQDKTAMDSACTHKGG